MNYTTYATGYSNNTNYAREYNTKDAEVDHLEAKEIRSTMINGGSIYSADLWSNTLRAGNITSDTANVKTLTCGNFKIDGLNGTLTFTDAHGTEHVVDLCAQAKLSTVVKELHEAHPEALVDLVMKGII